MRAVPLLMAALLAAAPAAARTPASSACQALSPGVNTLKGVLHEFHAAGHGSGAPGSHFVLQLDRPLCAREAGMKVTGPAAGQLNGRMLVLAFPGGDPRRFVGRRVLVSGTVLPSKTASGAVLQVGSFAPLPQVAADVS